MKKFLVISICVLLCFQSLVKAQSSQTFNYQGVARNSSGITLNTTTISIRISILDSIPTGTPVYVETHTTTTNNYGLFALRIGNGTPQSGSMTAVPWGRNNKYLKVEFDPNGGTAWLDMGTSQLLSVPYALYANNGNWNPEGNHIQNSNSGNVQVGKNTSGESGKFLVKSINESQNALRIVDSNTAGYPSVRIDHQTTTSFGKAMYVTSSAKGMDLIAKQEGVSVWSDSSYAGYFQNQNTNEPTVRIVNSTNSVASNALSVTGGNVKVGNSATTIPGKLAVKMLNEAQIGLHINDSTNLGYPAFRTLYNSSSNGAWAAEMLSNQNGLYVASSKRALQVAGNQEEAAFLANQSNTYPTLHVINGIGATALQVEGKTRMGTNTGSSILEVADTLSTFPAVNVNAGNNDAGVFTSTNGNGLKGISNGNVGSGVIGITYSGNGAGVAGIAAGGVAGYFQNNGGASSLGIISLGGKNGFGLTSPQELVDIAGNLKISNTGVGNTAPTGGAGTMRFNSSSSTFEGWNGSTWIGFGSGGSGFSLPYSSGNASNTTALFTLKNATGDAMQLGGKSSFNKYGNATFAASTTVDIDGELRLRDQQNQVSPTTLPGVIRFNNGVFSGYKGSTWLNFGTATGDNWGTQVVQHSTQFSGNGTTASPLALAQNGATTGQVLQWNGTNWLPATVSGGSGFWNQNGNDIYNANSGKILMGISSPIGSGDIQMNPQTGAFGLGTKIWTNNSYVNTVYIADSALSGAPVGCNVCSGNNALKLYTNYGTGLFSRTNTGDAAYLTSASGNALKIEGKVSDNGSSFAIKTGTVPTTTNTYAIASSFSNNANDIIVLTPVGGSNTNNITYILSFNSGTSQWEIKTKNNSLFEANLSFNLIRIGK